MRRAAVSPARAPRAASGTPTRAGASPPHGKPTALPLAASSLTPLLARPRRPHLGAQVLGGDQAAESDLARARRHSQPLGRCAGPDQQTAAWGHPPRPRWANRAEPGVQETITPD